MAALLKLALAGLAAFALTTFAAWAFQRKLMYFPDTERVSPAAAGLAGVEERVLATPDGEHVVAWYGRARPGQPTILYFHGNGGNLMNRAERMRVYMDRGRGVFMMSYRGYGGSTGTPSEKANVADAELAYRALLGEGLSPSQIVLYGESLGSGVVAQLAAGKRVAGVVLEAPYTAAVDVGALRYPFLPVRQLMIDRYETMRFIGRLTAPLLVIHGGRDGIVPVEMGRSVFEAAPEPKRLVIFPEAGHSDHHLFGSYEAINAWVDQLVVLRSLPKT